MDSNPPRNDKDGLSSDDNKKNPPPRRSTTTRTPRTDNTTSAAAATRTPPPTTTSGRSSTSAGGGGRPQPSESQLRQMEQDLLDKSRAAGTSNNDTTTTTTITKVVRRPGAGGIAAASSSGTSSRNALRQLEADLQIKNDARASGSASGSGAAAVVTTVRRVPSRGPVVGAQAVASAPSQNPKRAGSGARAVVGGGSQQGKGSNTSSTNRESRSSIRNLEEEIAAKTRGSVNSATVPPNTTADVPRMPSRTQQMEDDLVAKTRARSSFVSTSKDQPQRSQSTQRMDGQQRASLQGMEDDIVAKRRAQPSSFVSTTSMGSRGGKAGAAAGAASTAAMASTIAESSAVDNFDDTFADEYQNYPDDSKERKSTESQLYQPHPNMGDGDVAYRDSSTQQPTSDIGLAPLSLSHPERDYQIQESAPVVHATSQDIENAGIEAFVADHEVVDATGVAVVLSEEEEERLEKKRIRRYILYGILAFFAIAAGMVAAVILTVGQPDPPAPMVPTAVPSEAPSMVPSAAPTTTRLDAWIESLKSISSEEVLNNRTSPQYQAALWLADDDELRLEVGSARGLQRYALAVFYFALNGENWEQCGRQDPTCGGDPNDRTWLLSTEHECDWLGVDCDITNTIVTSIFFARQLGNGLSGYLPPELTLLTDLEALILQRNDLKGTLPGFLGKLKKLQVLFFLGNKFEGSIPEELLTGATLLGTIHFGENKLTGTIPTVVAQLPILTLNVANNLLTGRIPSELGLLTSMTYLELWNNRLTGPIPEQLYEATDLSRVRLQNNSLSGTLSPKLGRMVYLEELQLGDNDIAGPIPPAFYNMSSMVDFRCEDARLTGTLSSNIGRLNETLRRLYLSNNAMTGPLPIAAIESLSMLNELLLSGNDFTGTITKAICDSRAGGRFFDLQNLTVSPRVDCSYSVECCDLKA